MYPTSTSYNIAANNLKTCQCKRKNQAIQKTFNEIPCYDRTNNWRIKMI